MDDDLRWLLAGLILIGVVGWWLYGLRQRAAARRETLRAEVEATTRIEAAERFDAEQEADALSLREAADRQRDAEIEAEAAQALARQRAEAESRARLERLAADAEAEAMRLAVVARERLEAARISAEAVTLLAEAAARRIEAERLAAEVVARENAAREEAARVAEIREAERARSEQARLRQAEQARAEQQRAEQARIAVEQARLEAERIAARESAEREAESAARLAGEKAAAEANLREQAAREADRLRLAASQPEPAPIREARLPTSPEETLVLVADDSKIVRVKTGRLLALHKFRVAFAVDGADAERQIREERPHVVITDVEMPELDGFELTQRLRADPATADIPVIMITAADDKHREHAAQVGVNVLLGKPYPEDELVDHIRRVMNLDELQRRAEV